MPGTKPARSRNSSGAHTSRNGEALLRNIHGKPVRVSFEGYRQASVEADPFVSDLVRLLLTFFSVVVLDVVLISLITHRLRFWFPLWLDPDWASRRAPWVVYSQS
jgi:hypothetical protein